MQSGQTESERKVARQKQNAKWTDRNRTQSRLTETEYIHTETEHKVDRQKQETEWPDRNRMQSGQTNTVCEVVRQKQNTKWPDNIECKEARQYRM